MFTIPARITGIETAAEAQAARMNGSVTADEMEQMMQAEAEVAADRIKQVSEAYSHRGAPSRARGEQDGAALYHLIGGVEQYVREHGGDALLDAVVRALEHGASQ